MNIYTFKLKTFLFDKIKSKSFALFQKLSLFVFILTHSSLFAQSTNYTTSIDTVFTVDSVLISGTVYDCSEPTPTIAFPNGFLFTLFDGPNTRLLEYDNRIYSYDINLILLDDSVHQDTVVCGSYFWNGTLFNESGTYSFSSTNVYGCDSIVSLDLTILDSSTGTDVQTACDTFTWIDGNTYTSSNTTATHTLTNAAGCDSVVTLDLTINNSNTGTDVQTACDTFTWIDGNTYTSSNTTATHTLINAAGCDSVVTLDLTINNSNTGTDVQTACDTFTWIDGNTYTSSNTTSTHTLTNSVGCDSVVTLDLTIKNSSVGTDIQTACDTFTWIDGNTYTSSNTTATHTLTNSVGCDSVVTLDLTIKNSSVGADVQTACDTFTWIDGNTYTSSNTTATHTLTNSVGCDSVVTLDLTINNSNTGTDIQTACDTFTWIDGNTYTSSNTTATHTLTNAVGCDSVVTLDLTINNSNTGTDVQTACDTFTWIDGNTYTSSNTTSTHTLTNSVGCDSVVTLDLTIKNSTTGTDVQTACDTFTWIDGNSYTSSNTTATHTLTNSVGCDSVVTLDLTIKNSTTGTDVQTACDTFTWIDGNSYTSSNTTATHTLTNSVGCDSVVTLDLTINNSNTGTDIQTACDTFTWIDGNTYTSSNTTATHTLTNSVGCDSVVTLDLTIKNSSVGTDAQIHCGSFVWIDGNTYTSSNTTATHTLTNSVGCDSVVTLDLTINPQYHDTIIVYSCENYFWEELSTTFQTSTIVTYTFNTDQYCDSTVTLDIRIGSNSSSSSDVTSCDSYDWNGMTYTESGVYIFDTTNVFGCDSTATLNLTVNSSSSSSSDVTSCDSLVWNGMTYTESGAYTFNTTNVVGCDSMATLNLTIISSSSSSLSVSSCDSLVWNGMIYTESGVYTFDTTNVVGCDSTVTLTLTISSSSSSTSDVTSCDSYDWNGVTYTESGVYTLDTTNIFGCDSTATLNLTISSSSSSTSDVTSCDSLVWNGVTYTESGVYTFDTLNVSSCDSTATLNLTINSSSFSSFDASSCDSYDWNGSSYTLSGIYTFDTINFVGCDSIATLNLTIISSSSSSSDVTSCDSLVWNGVAYSESGVYTFDTTNVLGCDSTATLNLTISSSSSSSSDVTSCDSLVWNGVTYTESGVYTYDTLNVSSCDSTATLNLTISSSSSSTSDVTSCDSLVWNGVTYTESGVYAFDTTNIVGCDSIAMLNLTINISSSSSFNISSCDSYDWNGVTYTESGIYTFDTTNVFGCDSTVILNLTINKLDSVTIVEYACESFEWNGLVYSASGLAERTFTDSNGCDSVVTLDLRLGSDNSSDTFATSCDSYDWNGMTYTESGTYVFDTLNIYGCDSISRLHLTINNSVTGTDVHTACDTFTWIDGNTYTTSNDTARFTLTNALGCDSIVTLDLTINSSNIGVDIQTACGPYTWIDGNTYTESNNTATHILTNVAASGCDSVIMLDFTMLYSSNEVDVHTACDTFTWIDGITYTESNDSATFVLNYLNKWNVPNGDLTNWNSFGTNQITQESDAVKITGDGSSAFGARTFLKEDNLVGNLTLNKNYLITAKIKTSSSVGFAINDGLNSNISSAVFVESSEYVTVSLPFVANSETNAYIYLFSFSNNETAHIKDISLNETDENGLLLSCDSLLTLNLTILNSSTGVDVQTACDSFTWIDGNTYTESNNTATHIITNEAAACDSIVTLDLTINYSSTGTDVQSACDSFAWIDGNIYTESNNTATHTLTNSAGCDSVVRLDLTINNSNTSVDVQNTCDSFTWIDGNTYTESNDTAIHTLVNSAGCDSIVRLDLTMLYTSNEVDVHTACDSFTWIDGITYTESNNSATFVLDYLNKWNNPNGDVTNWDPFGTNQITQESDAVKITGDGSSAFGARIFLKEDNLLDNLTLNKNYLITAKVKTSSSVGFAINDGLNSNISSSVFVESSEYVTVSFPFVANSETNAYIYLFSFSNNETAHIKDISLNETDENGLLISCDSLITLNLTLFNTSTAIDVHTACDSFTWIDGNTYTESNNTATYTLANLEGCDSIVTLDLTINNSNTGIDVQDDCYSYTWIDGITYTESNNTATHTFTNSEGCDSVVTLDLTIHNNDTVIYVQTACDSFTWIDGNTYTESINSVIHTLTSVGGCDSIINLDLTISSNNTGFDVLTSCDSLTWIDGITYTESNNTATHILTNVSGCDSVVTLDLTIKNSSVGTDVQTACDTYTWIDGNTYTESNNIATYTLTNLEGCDSVVTLDLTINNSNTSIDFHSACGSFTWIDGNTYSESNNTATHVLTNTAGCDSVITLDLTVNSPSFSSVEKVACDSLIWNGVTYTESGVYTFNTINSLGCDSVATLNLTLNFITSQPVIEQLYSTTLTTDSSYSSYLWSVDGVELSNDITINVQSPGVYLLTVIDDNGCLANSDLFYFGVSSMDEESKRELSIFPNPSSDFIFVNYQSLIETLEIYNIDGKLVKSLHPDNMMIDIKDLKTGTYYITILFKDNKQYKSRIIKI